MEMNIGRWHSPMVILIDEEDELKISLYTWNLSGLADSQILTATIGDKTVSLPRYLKNYDGTDLIDHRDGNIFNNQKLNFRFANKSQNGANRLEKNINNTSNYRGVTWHKQNKKWIAQIMVNRKNINLGSFVDPIEAARAYDIAALKYFKEFARLNFPNART